MPAISHISAYRTHGLIIQIKVAHSYVRKISPYGPRIDKPIWTGSDILAFSIIPFVLLAIPVLEIAVFIAVGSQIGLFPTLGMIFLTAIAGSILLRVQGFGVLNQIRRTTEAGKVPGRELVHGVMILVAGVLLLTPGFITDTLGFLLFIPPLRDLGWKFLRDRVTIIGGAAGSSAGRGNGYGPARGRTIDLDATDYSEGAPGESPWRKPGDD